MEFAFLCVALTGLVCGVCALVVSVLALKATHRLEERFHGFEKHSRKFWDTNIWHHARTEALMKGEPLPAHPANRSGIRVQDRARTSFNRSTE